MEKNGKKRVLIRKLIIMNYNQIKCFRNTKYGNLINDTNIMIDYVFSNATFKHCDEKINKIIDKFVKREAISNKLYYKKDKKLRKLGFIFTRDIDVIRNCRN